MEGSSEIICDMPIRIFAWIITSPTASDATPLAWSRHAAVLHDERTGIDKFEVFLLIVELVGTLPGCCVATHTYCTEYVQNTAVHAIESAHHISDGPMPIDSDHRTPIGFQSDQQKVVRLYTRAKELSEGVHSSTGTCIS
jgi:hypothetical protein